MEKNKQRVLAYGLATVIANDALDSISGGSGQGSTAHNTLKETGFPGFPDVVHDVQHD